MVSYFHPQPAEVRMLSRLIAIVGVLAFAPTATLPAHLG